MSDHLLDETLDAFLDKRFANSFWRAGRETPRDLIKDIEEYGIQIEDGKPVSWHWLTMRNVGRKSCEVALNLVERLGFDWTEHIRPYRFQDYQLEGLSVPTMEKIIDRQITRLIHLIEVYRRLRE